MFKGFQVRVLGQKTKENDSSDINRKEINIGGGNANDSTRLKHADSRSSGGTQININKDGVSGKTVWGKGPAVGTHKEITLSELFSKKKK